MRVLIASVDVFTVARIKLTLGKEKIMHDTTDLGEDGLHLAKLYDYDIVLYDVTRSEIDGHKMLQRLRDAQVDAPILILSGFGELDQRQKARSGNWRQSLHRGSVGPRLRAARPRAKVR
jgi:two-component system, cell cycle response regulator CtrA